MKHTARKNDPARAHRAWVRFAAALICAFVLLAVSGFGFVKLLRGPVAVASLVRVSPGDYVSQDLGKILDNITVGYRNDEPKEVYAVAPVDRGIYVFCFPERWFYNEMLVREQTDAWLADPTVQTDRYLPVTGTAKTMPEELKPYVRAWFQQNEEALAQIGLIPEGAAMESCISECVIYVDRVGALPFGAVMLLTIPALVLIVYALLVLLRILLRGYPAKRVKEKVHG